MRTEAKWNERDTKGAGHAVAAAWLFVVLAILPLYMRDGLNRIGDAKYIFYRNVSVIFLAVTAVQFIISVCQRATRSTASSQSAAQWSAVDICILAYGATSVVSCCLSKYPATALWGYQDWYMGLFTQLLMIGGYFCVSRYYRRERWVEAGILLSAFCVSLLGVMNRYELDPLKVFSEMDRYDWNRANLLSTVGNINWYCGYLSVAVSILAAAYWNFKGHWGVRIAIGFGLFTGLWALAVQGSDSGYVVLAALAFVLLFCSLSDREKRLRFLEIAMMLPAACVIMSIVVQVKGRGLFLPNNSVVDAIVYSSVWWFALAFLLVCYLPVRYLGGKLPDSKDRTVAPWAKSAVWLAAGAGVILFAAFQTSEGFRRSLEAVSWLRFEDNWGSGRGFLWRVTWLGFWESGVLEKLFGAGPDCYAEYMYRHASMDLQVYGQFQDAVFANAHNEWLTMLLNEGLFGAVSYISFFLTAAVRFFRRIRTQSVLMAGALAVVTYSVNSFFSFQQVVSTPLLLMLIGACEASCRSFAENELSV